MCFAARLLPRGSDFQPEAWRSTDATSRGREGSDGQDSTDSETKMIAQQPRIGLPERTAVELPYDASAAVRHAAEPREAEMKPFWSPAELLSAAYVIDVRLDPGQGMISGTETVALLNDSSASIEQLAIRKGVWRAGTFTLEIDGERLPLSPSPEEADADTAILVTLPRAPETFRLAAATAEANLRYAVAYDQRLT